MKWITIVSVNEPQLFPEFVAVLEGRENLQWLLDTSC